MLETYRRRFRHVLVDEYQDTNHAQYALIHQLCAARPRGPARRRRRPAGGAGRADGRRRRRPVDLRVPRRQHPQHHGLRGRLPRRADDPAGAELPLDADDPHRRQRGDQPQRGPQGQEALVRRRRRRADRRLRRRRRARRGAVRRGRDQERSADAERPGRRRRGVLPDQRAVTCVRGDVHPHRPALPGGRRRPVLRAPRDPRRAGLPAAAGQPRRRDLAAPDHQRAQARHRRPRDRLRAGLRRAGAADLLGGAAPGRGGARHRHPVADPDAGASSR